MSYKTYKINNDIEINDSTNTQGRLDVLNGIPSNPTRSQTLGYNTSTQNFDGVDNDGSPFLAYFSRGLNNNSRSDTYTLIDDPSYGDLIPLYTWYASTSADEYVGTGCGYEVANKYVTPIGSSITGQSYRCSIEVPAGTYLVEAQPILKRHLSSYELQLSYTNGGDGASRNSSHTAFGPKMRVQSALVGGPYSTSNSYGKYGGILRGVCTLTGTLNGIKIRVHDGDYHEVANSIGATFSVIRL